MAGALFERDMADITLSDQQMAIVEGHGIDGWIEVELPTGRQPLPDWVQGAHVDWHNGYCNSPDFRLKTRGQVYGWEGQRWSKEGQKTYITRHPDGRCQVHYHGGSISMVELHDQRLADESVKLKDLPKINVRATEQQQGYAGAHIWITMTDGETLVLRGPWHGGAPAGYVEVYTVDMDSKYNANDRWNLARPWHKRSSTYGLYITEDLFLRIIARFCPHIRVARVNHSYGNRLNAYRAEWGMPKEFIYEIERGRATRHEPAGEFWRVYWDAHEGYCGSMRIPKYGFQAAVMDLPTEADYALAARKPW